MSIIYEPRLSAYFKVLFPLIEHTTDLYMLIVYNVIQTQIGISKFRVVFITQIPISLVTLVIEGLSIHNFQYSIWG